MSNPTTLSIVDARVMAVSNTSTQSDAVENVNAPGVRTPVTVRLVADGDCWVAVGEDPTAAAETAGSFFLPAGVVEYIDVPAGGKIAAVSSDGGVLSIAVARSR